MNAQFSTTKVSVESVVFQPGWQQRHALLERLATRDGLVDAELLELMLVPIASEAAHTLAIRLLEHFETVHKVVYAELRELQQVEGVTAQVCSTLRTMRQLAQRMSKCSIQNKPVFEYLSQFIDYCTLAFAYNKVEQFRVAYLDHNNRLIADEIMNQGTVNHTPAYPREIIKRAIELHAGNVILMHNHPTGNTTPTPVDIEITKKIMEALATVGITVYDHVIFGQGNYCSMKNEKLI